ncbi:MAG: hypothetical protein PWR10_709 [Halanaerobiales bacterium]|nr:hypothetical protein [Halanaerobiales bacterium]
MIKFWQIKIIDFYIIREVLIPFLVGVAIIEIIMLSSFLFQLTDLIIIKDIPLALVLRLLFYQLPEIIVQTFPISILFATMAGMGRLNRENEFTALRMGGISLYRLILPLIILGVFISGATYLLNEEVVPWSNHQAQNIIRQSILKQAMPDIRENVFFKGPEGRLFYVNKYNEKTSTLEKIVIYNFPDRSGFPEIITAQRGRVVKNRWRLESGIIHQYTDDGDLTLESRFEVMEYQLVGDMENFFGEQRTTSEMSRERLKKEIDLFKKSGINVDSLLIDYHLKLAMPLTALIFILIGTPLSLSNKDSRSASIILTIVIVFLFYLILSLSRSFGRNGELPPLLAAWLPNLVFALIGIILLIWRESWQNWLNRLLPFLAIILLLLFIWPATVSGTETNTFAENVKAASGAGTKLKLKGIDHLQYQKETGQMELMGDISGFYQRFHIKADKLIIKYDNGSEKIETAPREILISGGKITGCELDKPHYYFEAREVIIYPDDYLVAREVVFRELGGKLPLFYWPYLYISLKDRPQHLIPEIGYSATRGWFIKTTYNYWYDQRLPGELYLDYYTISGYGGGLKQYLYYEPDLKGSLYLYGQENRTDLPGLFRWQGAVDLEDQQGDWRTDTLLKYTYYDDHSILNGSTYVANISNKQLINFSSRFDSKDYFESDHNDDKMLNLDFSYRRKLDNDWFLDLGYNRDYLYNPEDGLKKRWGSRSYLARRAGNLDFKLTLERYAPGFSEDDDKVTFYRWPEVDLKYRPPGNVSYQLLLGRYYEDASGIKGYRGLGKITYDGRWHLSNGTTLSTGQTLTGKFYWGIDYGDNSLNSYQRDYNPELEPYLASYESHIGLKTTLTRGLTWNNRYSFQGYTGQTPFNFDRVNFKESINSKLSYRSGGLDLRFSTGYDLYGREYFPLQALLDWQVNPDWKIGAGTYYDPDSGSFGDLALTSKYKNEVWEVNSALKYNLEDKLLQQVDNQLIFDLKDEWYFALNTSYDNEDNTLKKANLLLKKNFHCRELGFSYDYLNQEFTIEYRINLFPDQGIKLGSSEEEPFMFDLGIGDLLEIE